MAQLLFRLRHVPEDEADEIRALLHDNDIDFYETSAGNWGISMPAIWLHKDDDYGLAISILSAYQRERSERIRQEYEAARAAGRAETQWTRLRQEPAKVIIYFAVAGVFLYLSVTSFFKL
jgi:hypothetical protein